MFRAGIDESKLHFFLIREIGIVMMSFIKSGSKRKNFDLDDDDILAAAYEKIQSQVCAHTIQSFQKSNPVFGKQSTQSLFTFDSESQKCNSSQLWTVRQNHEASQGPFHGLSNSETVDCRNEVIGNQGRNPVERRSPLQALPKNISKISEPVKTTSTDKSSKSLFSSIRAFAHCPREEIASSSSGIVSDQGEDSNIIGRYLNENSKDSKEKPLSDKELNPASDDYAATLLDIDFDENFDCDTDKEDFRMLQTDCSKSNTTETSPRSVNQEAETKQTPKCPQSLELCKSVSETVDETHESVSMRQSPLFPKSSRSLVEPNCGTPIPKGNRNTESTSSPDCKSEGGDSSGSIIRRGCYLNWSTVKRKFPGPAGILPYLPPHHRKMKLFGLHGIFDWNEEITALDKTLEHFDKDPWQHMLKDLSSHLSDVSLVEKFTVQAAYNKASKKKLPKHFAFPIMCVLLTDIKVCSKSIDSIFRDETGRIAGIINKEVMKKYGEYLVPFTALILQKPEFMCYQLMVRVHNIAAIYSANGMRLCLKDTSFNPDMLRISGSRNNATKKPMAKGSRDPHPENEACDIATNDNFESFFSDNMDDLLSSIDMEASQEC